MPLHNRLKEYRARLGINQQEMGARAGVSRQTISQIERGDYSPSVTLALKLAKLCGVTVEDIFTIGEDEHGELRPPQSAVAERAPPGDCPGAADPEFSEGPFRAESEKPVSADGTFLQSAHPPGLHRLQIRGSGQPLRPAVLPVLGRAGGALDDSLPGRSEAGRKGRRAGDF